MGGKGEVEVEAACLDMEEHPLDAVHNPCSPNDFLFPAI